MKKLIVLALAALLTAPVASAEDAPAPAKAGKTQKRAKKVQKKADDRTPFEKTLAKRIRGLKLDADDGASVKAVLEEFHPRHVEMQKRVKETGQSKDPLLASTTMRDRYALEVETLESLQSAIGDEAWARMVSPPKAVKKKKKKKKIATKG